MSTLPEDRRCPCGAYGPYGYDNLGRWFCAKHSPDRANDAARLIQARCRELLVLLIEQNLRDVESFAASCGGGERLHAYCRKHERNQTMNELTKVTTDQSSHFLELASDTLTSNVVGERLKFDRGRWVKGQNEVPMPEHARLLVCMPELQIGWVKFEAGKPVAHHLGYVRGGFKMPDRNELGDDDEGAWENGSDGLPKDPWSQTYIVLMRDMDTSELLTFLTNSKGGLQAVARLCQAFALGGYEEGGLCPVVALSAVQYQHPNPSFGKIWTPKFQITSWVPWTGAVAGEFGDAVRNIPPSEIPAIKTAAPKAVTLSTAANGREKLNDESPF